MKTIDISAPLTINPHQIEEPTLFVVKEDLGDNFAVTIEGHWRRNKKSEDRFDRLTVCPDFAIECNYLSKGACTLRTDNMTFNNVVVSESKGQALKVLSVRQSEFRTVRVHRCESLDSVVCITGLEQSFSPNMLRFGQLSCMANDAPITVELVNAVNVKNSVRALTIDQLLCHIAWPSMVSQFPRTASYGPRKRIHLDLGDSIGVTVNSVNLRMHHSGPVGALAVRSGDKCKDCVVTNGQILKRRDKEDISDLVSGPAVVFPFSNLNKRLTV